METTKFEDTCDATLPTPFCPQSATYGMPISGTSRFYAYESVVKQVNWYSENCQKLNIWTPETGEKLPVLVYIHGGGYMTGGSTKLAYSGAAYAKRGFVVVTINYRLNIFASAVGGGHTGNYVLWDQITALQWIRNNIAAFGGDPDCVTIMGESAGAMSVQNLIYSPLAKGLFHRAIMMSGGGIFVQAFAITFRERAEKLYSVWFSHPNVEQIIYWNLVDGYAFVWDPDPEKRRASGDMTRGENVYYGGLFRYDLSPKPACFKIKELLQERWHTEETGVSDETGAFSFRGFYGDYELTVSAEGKSVTKTVQLSKNRDNRIEVIL